MPSVLIICTANICRSPMGEGILKRLMAERPDSSLWRVESAGTWAYAGGSAAPLSQVVMQQKGIDISSHQSKPVTEELISQFDLILTMENHHKEGLLQAYKEFADRIFMISEMVGREDNINDPIGGDLEDYQETADKLERYLSNGLERIEQLANRRQSVDEERNY